MSAGGIHCPHWCKDLARRRDVAARCPDWHHTVDLGGVFLAGAQWGMRE